MHERCEQCATEFSMLASSTEMDEMLASTGEAASLHYVR